jgi:hypothetical protein
MKKKLKLLSVSEFLFWRGRGLVLYERSGNLKERRWRRKTDRTQLLRYRKRASERVGGLAKTKRQTNEESEQVCGVERRFLSFELSIYVYLAKQPTPSPFLFHVFNSVLFCFVFVAALFLLGNKKKEENNSKSTNAHKGRARLGEAVRKHNRAAATAESCRNGVCECVGKKKTNAYIDMPPDLFSPLFWPCCTLIFCSREEERKQTAKTKRKR